MAHLSEGMASAGRTPSKWPEPEQPWMTPARRRAPVVGTGARLGERGKRGRQFGGRTEEDEEGVRAPGPRLRQCCSCDACAAAALHGLLVVFSLCPRLRPAPWQRTAVAAHRLGNGDSGAAGAVQQEPQEERTRQQAGRVARRRERDGLARSDGRDRCHPMRRIGITVRPLPRLLQPKDSNHQDAEADSDLAPLRQRVQVEPALHGVAEGADHHGADAVPEAPVCSSVHLITHAHARARTRAKRQGREAAISACASSRGCTVSRAAATRQVQILLMCCQTRVENTRRNTGLAHEPKTCTAAQRRSSAPQTTTSCRRKLAARTPHDQVR